MVPDYLHLNKLIILKYEEKQETIKRKEKKDFLSWT